MNNPSKSAVDLALRSIVDLQRTYRQVIGQAIDSIENGDAMNIDKNTGLPEVPEGYFWRIKWFTPRSNEIQLRKKTWYGSKEVDREIVLDPHSRVEYIKKATSIMLHLVNRDLRESFLGDYPPKTLKVEWTDA